MIKYYAFLRGINVSGKNKIKMKEFVEILEKNNFKNVITYIQSGNIIFESDNRLKSELEYKIKKILSVEYNYDVPVIICNEIELRKVKENNPFDKNDVDKKKLYYSFLFDLPSDENMKSLSSFNIGNDKYEIHEKILYIRYDISAGKSKLNNVLIERKLKLNSTIRNYNTINKLINDY